MHCKRITLALLIGGAFAPHAQAGQDYSPEWWLSSAQKACQSVVEGVARCLAGPTPAPQAAAPFRLPALPSPFPGMDPKTNPYLVHTPYAQGAGSRPAEAGGDRSAPEQALGAHLATASPAGSSAPPAGAASASTVVSSTPTAATPGAQAPLAATDTPANPGMRSGAPASSIAATPMKPSTAQAIRSAPAFAAPLAGMPVASAPVPLPAPTPSQGALAGERPAAPGDAPSRPIPESASPALLARQDDALAHFEFDKAELTDAGRAALDAWWAKHVAGLRARIAGHADRFGPERYNLALSRRRAESVAQYLTGKGMKAEELVIVAKGESEPRVTCNGGPNARTIACLAPNRRVEIVSEAAPATERG
jgi:outer membrane protein OmpA-like peptidoglycan-associated protein